MKRATKRLATLLAGLCALGVVFTIGERQARAHLVVMNDLPEGCRTLIDGMPIDADISPSDDSVYTVPGFLSEGCLGYTWVRVYGPLRFRVQASFGPNITSSAWDCQHSTLTWAIYEHDRSMWRIAGGGIMYGKLENGQCKYDPENFPHGQGSASQWIERPAPHEYRVAIQSWQHNERRFGHPGTACDTPECHHPSELLFTQVLVPGSCDCFCACERAYYECISLPLIFEDPRNCDGEYMTCLAGC